MFWKLLAAVAGGFVALFPRRTIDYLAQAVLGCFENPEDLEPTPWLVSAVRLKGTLIAIAALASLALSIVLDRRSDTDVAEDSDGDTPSTSLRRWIE